MLEFSAGHTPRQQGQVVEEERLDQLFCYSISAETGDSNLDSITQIAVDSVAGDIGGISLIYQTEIWLPARVGIDISSIPRAGSFCTCAIQADSDDLFEIENARTDVRFHTNALVTAARPYLHYAAVPLRGAKGYLLGTLWIMRHTPGRLTPEQSRLFTRMGKLVVETLELRHTNDVTGLSNRSALLRHLDVTIKSKPHTPFMVGYVDLIGFGHINHSLGWTGGNEVLRVIARRLSDWVGPHNDVAHIGGDKFAFALFGARDDLSVQLERLTAVLGQPVALQQGGEQLVQARIGIAQREPGQFTLGTELLAAADTAAQSIDHSLNATTIRQYGDDLRYRTLFLTELHGMLIGNTDFGHLVPYYQPQVNFSSGALIGLEALARWQHPVKGLVMPAQFIALAESTGQIYALDCRVLDHVCKDLRRWIDAGLIPVPVSFNYSRSSLLNPHVIMDFSNTLNKYSIPGKLLELEITETQLLENVESISQRVSCFRELGVRIAVDDFGTGYSNLDAIHSFPFDRLKVDRQFVHGVSSNARLAGIFQLIHGIADLFQAELLCEGLETIEDLRWLQSRHAFCVQGWYFSAARSFSEIEVILNRLRNRTERLTENGSESLLRILN